MHLRLWICLVLLAVLATTGQAQDYIIVDQAVEDLDPLATSLRQRERGLNIYGEQSSLFRRSPDLQDDARTYYRVGPGYRATLDRIDYVVITGPETIEMNVAPPRDGEFHEIVPPNTVFDLRPVSPDLAITGVLDVNGPPQPPPPNLVDARLAPVIGGGSLHSRLDPVRFDQTPLASPQRRVSTFHMGKRAVARSQGRGRVRSRLAPAPSAPAASAPQNDEPAGTASDRPPDAPFDAPLRDSSPPRDR